MIGVPLTSKTSVSGGLDALLAIAQMPPGVPVATVGVDNPKNAAVLAARILSSVIERYTRPEMGAVWSERRKLDTWLQVELAVVDALAEQGVVPDDDAATIRDRALVHGGRRQGAGAGHGPRRGGVRGRRGRVGGRGRPLGAPRAHLVGRARHRARAPALAGRADPRGRRGGLQERAHRARARARGHALRGPHARRARGAHDLRREAGRLRLRGAPQPDAPRARRRGGVGGRAVGRGGHLRRQRPGGRGGGAEAARPRARGGVDAGGAARPARRALVGDRRGRRRARALRHRDQAPPAHRGARGGGAVPRGRAEGLVGDAAQAQPDRHGADHRDRAAAARLRADRARERGALARARHQPLLGRARDRSPTRRSCSTTPSTWRSGWSRG